jgi:hypothetical protein
MAGANRRIARSLLFVAAHTISRRCRRQKAPPAGGPASEAPWGCGCCQRRGTISAHDRAAACDRTLDYPQEVKRRRTGKAGPAQAPPGTASPLEVCRGEAVQAHPTGWP